MSGHEQYGEDLALYALNALAGDDRAKLEQHLASCSECRLELEQLRGDGALLTLSTLGPKPPARSRQRLLDDVAKESAQVVRQTTMQQTSHPRVAWPRLLGWIAAAAMSVFVVLLWKENTVLRQSLAVVSDQSMQTSKELEELRRVAAPILSPQAQRITLVSMKTAPQPQGKAFYLRNRSNLVFVANNMPSLPPQKAYELWLIPMQGAPMPAGMFKPDARGSATVVNPPIPAGTQAKAFAITIENEAGSSTPTMPIVMMGTGE